VTTIYDMHVFTHSFCLKRSSNLDLMWLCFNELMMYEVVMILIIRLPPSCTEYVTTLIIKVPNFFLSKCPGYSGL
jgi:hypothetical protein